MTHPQTPPCAARAVPANGEAALAGADVNGAASEPAGASRLPATTTTSKAFRIRATPCGPLDRAGGYSARLTADVRNRSSAARCGDVGGSTLAPDRGGSMSTRTSPRSSPRTTPRAGRPQTGRFNRTSTSQRRPATRGRRPQPNRYGIAGGVLQRRRTPPPSGLKGALAGLGGVLPAAGKARGKATPSSKKGKAGGVALLTAAAGFAFSNRDKLGQLIKRSGSADQGGQPTVSTPPATATTTTPPATTA